MSKEIWDSQHTRYSQTEWINKPSLFAEWAVQHFPSTGSVLELGSGQGQDTRFFANKNYQITALDYSENGLSLAKEKTDTQLVNKIIFAQTDISQVLEFGDKSFDVVYSHLALHYFDENTTRNLFKEIYRVLKDGGVLAFLVNSTQDPEYGTGEEIEDSYYIVRDIKKRFFDLDSVRNFTNGLFEEIVLDDKGETYKDRAIGTEHLIRFVGKKI